MAELLPIGWFTPEDIEDYRMLVSQIPEQGRMAELGVWKGRSLCSIADIIKERKIAVTAVDTFKGSWDAGEPTNKMIAEASKVDVRKIFEGNIQRYHIDSFVSIVESKTVDAAGMFDNETFYLVFIDAEHTAKAVGQDINCWLPKVKPGGVIAGHDWGWQLDMGFNNAIVKALWKYDFHEGKRDLGIWWARK